MTFAIVTAPRHDSQHWHAGKVTWDDVISWMKTPAKVKECGNYVFGTLRETTVDHPGRKGCTHLHRRKEAVVSRSALTLDVDHPRADFVDRLELLFPYSAVVHTTFNSAPDAPRYRVIFPTDREMTPEEYHGVSSVLMERIGWKEFDVGSVQPERYMFNPSAQHPDWFEHWVFEGSPVPVDELLEEFDPDLSKLPMPGPSKNKRSPFELGGVVGAFNCVYSIDEVIEVYDIPYEKVSENRWHLVGATSQAGVSLVADGLVFSHHVNDPAGGQTCSAFDLVRLHRFADLDDDADLDSPVNRRPSHEAMLDLAAADPRVVAEVVGTDFDSPTDGWKLGLRVNKRTGKLIDHIDNWDLIRQNDPAFTGLYFNELTMSVETERDLPWRPLDRGGRVFGGTDRAALCHQLEREHGIRPSRTLVDELVNTTAQRRYVNPIRDYLEALRWDGLERVEECLPGVRPTDYTRMVARKCLVAAVARMFDPGCKWDHTLVLFGNEGLGKSFWIDRLSRGYSATLGRIDYKDTLLTMQRSWIMVSDEGYSLRKADADVQKEFLTRREDVFRMPYERESLAHPRHCVIWGTTNDEVFLRRQEGNRRFLIVHSEEKVDFSLLTEDYVDQLWAEAVTIYRAGELLFLGDVEGQTSAVERERFTEEDALAGVLKEFLDTLVPDTWDSMSPESRRLWMANRADELVPVGTQRITETCSAQLWVEALGRRFGDHKRNDLLDINTALKHVSGWTARPGRHRVNGYGPQLVFARTDSIDDPVEPT